MPSAAKLAQGALEYTIASHSSRIASTIVPTDPMDKVDSVGAITATIATAAAPASTAIADSARDERIACHTDWPSLRLGVRKKAASRRTRPLRHASETTQLSANQQRRQRTASPMLQWDVVRIAQSARPTPVTRNTRGTSASGPMI